VVGKDNIGAGQTVVTAPIIVIVAIVPSICLLNRSHSGEEVTNSLFCGTTCLRVLDKVDSSVN